MHIDHSPGLGAQLDIPALCRVLRDKAVETGVFPLAGIRIRVIECDYALIADGNPDHAYLDISVRLRGGRDLETHRNAVQLLFDATKQQCEPLLEKASFALSMEMRDIDPELNPKTSSIRRYLPEENT
jgi:5-carboxymethyl-2-hydroxymuconate isomerase